MSQPRKKRDNPPYVTAGRNTCSCKAQPLPPQTKMGTCRVSSPAELQENLARNNEQHRAQRLDSARIARTAHAARRITETKSRKCGPHASKAQASASVEANGGSANDGEQETSNPHSPRTGPPVRERRYPTNTTAVSPSNESPARPRDSPNPVPDRRGRAVQHVRVSRAKTCNGRPPKAGRTSPPSSCALKAAAYPRRPAPHESFLRKGERERNKEDRSGGTCAFMPCPTEYRRGAAVACNHAPQDAALPRVPRAAEKIISTPPRLTTDDSAVHCKGAVQDAMPGPPPLPHPLPRVPGRTHPRTNPARDPAPVAGCTAGESEKGSAPPRQAEQAHRPQPVAQSTPRESPPQDVAARHVAVRQLRRSPRLQEKNENGGSLASRVVPRGKTGQNGTSPAASAKLPSPPSIGRPALARVGTYAPVCSRSRPHTTASEPATQQSPRPPPPRSAPARSIPIRRRTQEVPTRTTCTTTTSVVQNGHGREPTRNSVTRRGGSSRLFGYRSSAQREQASPSATPEAPRHRPGTDAQGRLSEPVVAATLNTHGHTLCSRAHHLLAEAGGGARASHHAAPLSR